MDYSPAARPHQSTAARRLLLPQVSILQDAAFSRNPLASPLMLLKLLMQRSLLLLLCLMLLLLLRQRRPYLTWP